MKQRKFLSILVSTSMAFNVLSATTGSVVFAAEESDDLIATEETTDEIQEEDQTEVTEDAEVQEAVEETSEDEIVEDAAPDEEEDLVEESEETEFSEETEEYVEEETVEEEPEEEPELPTAFSDEAEAGGFIISVTADEGVFPDGSYMIVNTVEDEQADSLVDDSRNDDVNVAYSMTFDITVYDIDGNEIEPNTEAGNVYVSFTASDISNDNLDVDVYHITDDAAVLLDTDVYEDTVIAETDGFSYYTVEFTYNDLQYVLDGDSIIELSEILDYVGLQGNVSNAEVSNSYLFSAYEEDGVWYVSANNPFTTNEWMKVTIDGIEYTIDVTDAVAQSASNSYIGYRVGSGSPAGWQGRGYDIYGLDGSTTLRTTYNDAGYCSQMRVGNTTTTMVDGNNNFEYGKIYSCAGINAYITASIQGERSVVVTYTMTNTTGNTLTLDIGSWSDCKIGDNDKAPIEVNSNGIRMYSGSNQFFLIPGSGDFDTCWYGGYSSADDNVFTRGQNSTGTLNDTDSGLAFSWNVIIPAGATVTRTAIFSVGANMTSYNLSFNKNSSEATGTMSNQLMISGIAGSISGCKFTRTGYSFVGWAESATGSVVYADQQQITLTGHKTLYAVWMPSSAILTDPTAISGLVYTGSPQALLQGGGARNGTIQFSIDRVNYSPEYPTGINATSYTIYYKAVGNPGYGDSEVRSITNSIAKGNPVVTAPTAISGLTYNGSAQNAVNPGSTNGGTMEYSLNGSSWSTSIPQVTSAGTYTIYYRVQADNNVYAASARNFQITVAKKNAVINANDRSKTYGSADPALTVTYTGLASGTTSLNYTISRAAGENVGTYTITVVPGTNPNYNVTVVGGTFTINPKAATITAVNNTKIYGTNDPQLRANVSGTVGSDTLDYTISRVAGETVGTYEIRVILGTNPNYNVTITNATFTITRADALIRANNAFKIYGSADPTLTATVTGTVGSDELNYTLSRAEGENAGTYVINVNLGDNPNYNISVASGTFTINPKAATITADPAGKVYGESDPTLTATVTGTVGDDVLSYTVYRVEGENVGTYSISVAPGNNPNYSVSVVSSTFAITPAQATVSANDLSRIYGDNDPQLTATVTGTVGSDELNYTLSREEGEDVGTYVITVTLGENPNYDITTEDGTFTIDQRAVVVSADDLSKIYGDEDPELTATETNVVREDVLDYTVSREEGENAGEYVITITLGENPNYDITTEDGTFTISQADALISADDLSKIYGDEDPELTVTITGTVGEDVLDFTVAREEGEIVGTYVITVTLGENPNYDIITEEGTFTIDQRAVVVSADDLSKIYGDEDPELTATETNVVGDDVLDYTVSREEGENVGTYVITVTLGENLNYDITTEDGTFTVDQKEAVVAADDTSKIYGEDDVELTATVTGTVGDDELEYTVSREEGENAGEYVITITLGENPNYDITTEDGTFTILKADPVVTAPIGVAVDYTGEPQALFIPGTTTGGTLEYSFDGVNYYTGTLRGISDGYYVILYRVTGDNNYNSTETRYIVARINTVMVSVTFVDPTTGLPYGGNGTTGNGGSGTSGLPNSGNGTTGNGGSGTSGLPNGGSGTTGNGGSGANGLPNGGNGTTGNGEWGPIGLPIYGTGTTGNGDIGTTGNGGFGTEVLPFDVTGTTSASVLGAFAPLLDGSEITNTADQGYAAAGHALTAPDDPSRYGYDFNGWYADEECTIPFDFDHPIGMNGATVYAGWESVDYHLTEGEGNNWVEGDEGTLRFRAVRNRLEETTFSHYMNVMVDGQLLSPEDYTARSGSVIIELSPEFLATLGVGEHELNIVFDDADSVTTYFNIEGAEIVTNAASGNGIVSTGEEANNMNIVAALVLLIASSITSVFYFKTKKEI